MLLMHAAATVASARQGASRTEMAADTSRRGSAPRIDPVDFSQLQLQNPRVMQARLEMRFGIKRMFRERGISYPAAQVFIRIFKRERVLELWVRPTTSDRFALLKEYRICALAGELGPKRNQGDGQTPEGFYDIDRFNPWSDYFLSLHVNYPNRSDVLLARSGNLGGDIFIHGGCETAGCIAVTDKEIKELYWISVEARAAGQQRIPVHIFPARMTREEMDFLARSHADDPDLVNFWTTLKPGYDYFEQTRQLPPIRVDARGRYGVMGEAEAAVPSTATQRGGN
jgi:murein L,D-transpeptidase YafK